MGLHTVKCKLCGKLVMVDCKEEEWTGFCPSCTIKTEKIARKK